MSEAARAWLAQHTTERVPASLAQVMNEALASATSTGISMALGDAALHELEIALHLGNTRDAAIHLLAADALLTAACEAAADEGAAVASIAERFDSAALAAQFAAHLAAERA